MTTAKRFISPYAYLLPGVVYLSIWIYYPIARNFYISLLKSDEARSGNFEFVGLDNYRRILTDELFYRAMFHNLAWVALSVVIPVTIGLVLAVLLVQRRARLFYAAVFFLPATVAPIMSAIVWGWIYNPTFGALNQVLSMTGLAALRHPWLADPATALISVNMIGSWSYYGFCTLIFLAGLQNIDFEIYDAARIDGATALQRFTYLTLPLLKPTLIFVLVYTIIGSMKFFDIIYVATKGGPDNSTQIVAVYLFELFIRQREVSYAAAMSNILTLIILVMSLVLVRHIAKAQ